MLEKAAGFAMPDMVRLRALKGPTDPRLRMNRVNILIPFAGVRNSFWCSPPGEADLCSSPALVRSILNQATIWASIHGNFQWERADFPRYQA